VTTRDQAGDDRGSEDKVLVVGPSWVGDMVMAQALYKLLRRESPTAEIHVVAPPWSLPVLARMPEVAQGVELDVGHGELGLGRRRALGRRLRAERYTRAIVLPRSAKAALVPWFAGVPRRTGFRGEWRYGLLNDVRPLDARLDQTVKRFVALGQPRGAEPVHSLPSELRPRLVSDASNLERLRAVHALRRGAPLVALMPGAEYGPAKRWPAAHYGALAAELASADRDVVVLGSAKERPIGAEVVARASHPRVLNLCGATSLADVLDLLAAAEVAVSNDSGLLHVAAAAGAPVVAIYGSSSPQFTPPLTPAAAVLWLALECSPCFARECPLGHLRCLKELLPANVLRAVESVRAQREAAPRAERLP
jgi:heptosyltransferase-2